MSGRLLGLDLGGTNIKVAVLEEEGGSYRPLWVDRRDTRAESGPDAVAGNLISAIEEASSSQGQIETIGLGVPGLFTRETGVIRLFPNLPGPWSGYPLRESIQSTVGRDIWMINDARAFTLAEGTLGAGAGFATIACLTLGTGVGGGIMFDGRLHLGSFGVAGEIGHQIIDPDGPVCGCGNRGCVEAKARADVLTALAGKESVTDVYRSAAAGDEPSRAAIEQVADCIGIGLANVVTLLGPDVLVIGGGIIEAGDEVLQPIRRAVQRRVTLVPPEGIRIVPAALGSWAGAYGAALAGLLKP